MAKDSLTDAIFELKDKGRNPTGLPPRRKQQPKRRVNQKRPRAFDSFHVFSLMLLALGMALQVVALVLYA